MTTIEVSEVEITKCEPNTEITRHEKEDTKREPNTEVTKHEKETTKCKPNTETTKCKPNTEITKCKPNTEVTKHEKETTKCKPNTEITKCESTSVDMSSKVVTGSQIEMVSFFIPRESMSNVSVIKLGGEYSIPSNVGTVIIDTPDRVVVILPLVKVEQIPHHLGVHIYQNHILKVIRLTGDHLVKTPNTNIKINSHMVSVHLDAQTTKYDFVATVDGWIAY